MGLSVGSVGLTARAFTQAAKPAKEPSAKAGATDRYELSEAALAHLNEAKERQAEYKAWQEAMKNKQTEYSGLLNQLDDSNKSADAQGEVFRVQARCMKISSNVISGKRVPTKDLQYLMEHDIELYQMAMAMRRTENKDKKECKSVLDDEKDTKTEAACASAPGATPPDDAAPPADAPAEPATGCEGETA